MTSAADLLDLLKAQASPDNLEGMARFGMAVEKRLGVSVPEMRRIAMTYSRPRWICGATTTHWVVGALES
jgi:3-methyladenine DNA glycosylase AlkD